jgi:NADPH:quinone reductase-like Zn-dependent oxidoreductase
VIVGSEGRGRWLGGFDRNLRTVALSRLVGQRLRMLSSKPRPEDLQRMRELLEAGKATPVIDRTYPANWLQPSPGERRRWAPRARASAAEAP